MNPNKNIRNDYLKRINRVLDYIQENLERSFQLKELSLIGNFSSYHFHRIFTAHLHEPIGVYIKRIRLQKAAQLLQFSKNSVTEISIQIGYETLSSFSDAFSKYFGISPTAYRKNHNQLNLSGKMEMPSKINFDFEPEIKILPSKKIAFTRVFGKYNNLNISKSWDALFDFASKNKLMNNKTEFFGISYDNPEITDQNKCQYNACISIDKEIKPQEGIGIKEIQGGKYAIFTYKGDYENFGIVYQLIFKEWLLKSDYELRDSMVFDKYLNTLKDTEPNELLTQIHLPIQRAS